MFRVSGFGFRVPGFGFRDPVSGFRDPVSGFQVSGFGGRTLGGALPGEVSGHRAGHQLAPRHLVVLVPDFIGRKILGYMEKGIQKFHGARPVYQVI
jgi:hypothetical protein